MLFRSLRRLGGADEASILRAIGGEEEFRKLFLESPADFNTRAPNDRKLG